MLPWLLAMLAVAPALADLITLDTKLDISQLARCQEDTVASCQGIRINLAELEAQELTLPGGSKLVLVGRPGHRSTAFSNDNGAEAIFSRNNGRVFGTIQTEKGDSLVIEPCSKSNDGCHILIKQNIDVLDKINEKGDVVEQINVGEDYTEDLSREALEQLGKDDSKTEVIYFLKVYYTYEFRDAPSAVTVSEFINLMVANINQGYINSKIPVRVKLHCMELADLHDNQNGQEMLDEFRALKGTEEKLRQTADAAMLLVNNFNLCGIGWPKSWAYGLSLTAVARGCAYGRKYTTPGHELGHNFGCGHDRIEGDRERWQTSYAWGKHFAKIRGEGYRTIMAYWEGPRREIYRKQVNFYSSPDVEYLKTGKRTGSATEDCARVIRENRFVFAAQGDESDVTCRTTTTVAPTTIAPTTVAPTTLAFTTVAPTTVASTTVAPTTVDPTTVAPTKVAPTTVASTTAASTTIAPTTVPTTKEGSLVSPNFPSNYPNNLGKSSIITVSRGSVVKVKFISFDLEAKYGTGRIAECADHLSAKDGDGTVLMEQSCGSFLPDSFTSKSNKVVFTFVTDYGFTKPGYRLSWRAVREK